MLSQFSWTILQSGQLPLQPDGSVRKELEHRCTTTLIWPAGALPQADNTLMIDPCFTLAGYTQAEQVLDQLGASIEDIGAVFVTHLHTDHLLRLPESVPSPRFRPFRPITRGEVFAAVEAEASPGHHPSQETLHFEDAEGKRVWVAGDAVLSAAWLREWAYFWPNGYGPLQIVETWRSIARIVSQADVIVPGHDAPLPVTVELVQHLLETFPQANYASRCPDVPATLQTRLDHLRNGSSPRAPRRPGGLLDLPPAR